MKNAIAGVLTEDALDILFAHRNRTYGAYVLRRSYPVHLARALAATLLIISLGLALPQLLGALSGIFPEKSVPDTRETWLDNKLLIETPPPQPPAPPTPPPPARMSAALVPIVLVKDLPKEAPVDPSDELPKNEGMTGPASYGPNNMPPSFGSEPLPAAIPVPEQEDTTDYPIYSVQKQPSFPGGEKEMFRFIQENLKYPPLARENNIQGRVAVTFVVNKDGSIGDAMLLKDIGGGCGKEAMRIIMTMPKWIPGEANGHPVRVRYTLPVQFKLE